MAGRKTGAKWTPEAYWNHDQRILQNYKKDDNDCWVWQGRINNGTGYGQCNSRGRLYGAHRFFYSRYIGSIKKDYVVHHKCRNRMCVNPMHLAAVPQAVNVQEGIGTKLTRQTVKEIKVLFDAGVSCGEISKKFGIDVSHVYKVAKGLVWRDAHHIHGLPKRYYRANDSRNTRTNDT